MGWDNWSWMLTHLGESWAWMPRRERAQEQSEANVYSTGCFGL